MKSYRNEDAFLELMRSGIWGKAPDLDYFKDLTEFDWLEIYMIAGKQTVLGVCLKPILDLPNNLKPPTKLLLQWVGLNRFIEANNYKMLHAWQELNSKLQEAGFEAVVMKGMSVAKWYASPMSRQSSDVDLFISDKFEDAIQLIKSWGIKCKHKAQHDIIVYRGVTFEIHPKIFTVPYRPQLDYSIQTDKVAGDQIIRVLDPNINSLLLLSHAAGHFLIPGIGYRFLCDWAVYLKNNYERIDCKVVLGEAKRMGMHRFVIEFTKLAEVKLGLDFPGLEEWTRNSSDKHCVRLADELMEQGDFGAINFQKDFKGSKLLFGFHVVKSLLACRYYWPKLFWRRAPRFLYKLIAKQFRKPKESK